MTAADQHNFILQPSIVGYRLAVALIFTVLVLIWYLPIQLWAQLFCSVCALFMLVSEQIRWFSATPRLLVYQSGINLWQLVDRHGSRSFVAASQQFVLRRLVILQFKTHFGLAYRIYVPSDSVTPEEHHQLRRLVLSMFSHRA